MKQITIYSSNIEPVLFEDDSNELVDKYSETLSDILNSNNVVILHTTTGSIIIRPNTISTIIVTESYSETFDEDYAGEKKIIEKKVCEDTITD